jgi:hypothetical protein
MNHNYQRVIPRDLFNEAKLLKCMGRLVLKIHDNNVPVPMTFEHDGNPFKIVQQECGSLRITNLKIFINDKPFIFHSTYNSKSNYCLHVVADDFGEPSVFDENGDWDEEFIDFVNNNL